MTIDEGPPPEQWTVPFASGPAKVGPARFLSSSLLLGLLAAAYCVGVVAAARMHLGFEIIIAVGVPVLCLAGGLFDRADPRIFQLVIFESTYNVLAAANQGALLAEQPALATGLGWAFLGFFVVQALGFIAFEYKEKRPFGMVASAALGALILVWFSQCADQAGAIDAEGRFLMWGTDAPLTIRACYLAWLFTAAVGDMNDVYVRAAVLHFASTAVALASGEFFHARLLTAASLLALDLAFGFTRIPSKVLPKDFAVLTVSQRQWFFDRVRPAVAALSAAACVAIVIAAALRGLDL